MNIYQTKFFTLCPNNGLRIEYDLQITTDKVLMVEKILEAVSVFTSGYHEDIADSLLNNLGGKQILKAHHHGVDIITVRGVYD